MDILKEKISDIIKREVEDFKTKDVQIVKGYSFNQYKTIRKINLYINDKYEKRKDEALFWNISNSRIIHFAKNIDLDTKDLQPVGKGETNFFQSWILKMKFKHWLDKNHFALVLNDLSEGVATYGSSVWKRFVGDDGKTTLEEVDLRNLYITPTAKSIKESPVVEIHYLYETEIMKKSWENKEEIIEKAKKVVPNVDDNIPDLNKALKMLEIWERWGEVRLEDGTMKYKHYIGAGYGDDETIAFEEDVDIDKDFPYYDFHIGRYRGRWLRVGVVERLFSLQKRANMVVNENAQATSIASLLLLRSQDPNTTGNVLEGAENGQIIQSSDLQQIGIDNRAFNVLLTELKTIEAQADKICLTPEVISGDMLPSQIPFRTVATMSAAAKSAFKYIRESIGEKIGYILKEEILPSVVKDWNKEHLFEIAEDEKDVKIYDEAVSKYMKLKMLKEHNKNGRAITPEEISQVDEVVSSQIEKVGRKIKVDKGFFNFEYGIDFNITGENIDKTQQNDAFANVLQYIMQNPAIQSNPYFRQYAENNGITPIRMTSQEMQQSIQQTQQGAIAGQGQVNQTQG